MLGGRVILAALVAAALFAPAGAGMPTRGEAKPKPKPAVKAKAKAKPKPKPKPKPAVPKPKPTPNPNPNPSPSPSPTPNPTPNPTPSPAASLSGAVLADNPIAYWKLGSEAAAAGPSLSAFAGPAFGAGGVGGDGMVELNGASQYLEAPFSAALNPAGAFTVEAWAKVTGGAGTVRSIVTSRDWDRKPDSPRQGFILYAIEKDHWQFFIGNGTKSWTVVQGGLLKAGEWTHLVGTYDGTAARLYVNGAAKGEPVATAYAPNRAAPLRIGAGTTEKAPDFFFPGAIDDVAVYGSALSPERVLTHFLLGRT